MASTPPNIRIGTTTASNGTRDIPSTPANTVSAVKEMTTKEPNTKDTKTIKGRKPKQETIAKNIAITG